MTQNLPQLTPDEATAVGILLVSREPMVQVAADCGMSLLEFVTLCSRPNVQAHIEAARNLARQRADVIVQDARVTAVHTLKDIADSPKNPTGEDASLTHAIERRRAATTLLRAAQPRSVGDRRRHAPRRLVSPGTHVPTSIEHPDEPAVNETEAALAAPLTHEHTALELHDSLQAPERPP